MKNKKIGILGYGQIGKAIREFYNTEYAVWIQEKTTPGSVFPDVIPLDVLHICIPWSKEFIDTVLREVRDHCPAGLTIIHSTVPVGTTQHIAKELGSHAGKFLVHSPVRGVHPDLKKGIETFPKYIGADFSGAGRLVAEHFIELGIKPVVLFKSKTSELLKLLDTTYYGLAIAFHAYAADLCERENVPFDPVMTAANKTYNEGYEELGKPGVVRPVLYPPDDGKIGGHCIIPNAKILSEQFGDDPLLGAILRHE